MKETAYTGILNLGLQGGYYQLPDRYASTAYTDSPYYYYHGDILSPSLSDMEDELGRYVQENIDDCLLNYHAFTDKGYTVAAGQRRVYATIGENDVTFELDMPLTIIKEDQRHDFDRFLFKRDIRLKEIYDLSQELTANVYLDPNNIAYSFLIDKMEEYGVQIDNLKGEDGIVVYVIDDPQSVLWPGTNLMYIFATKTDLSDKRPIVEVEETFTVKVGERLLESIIAYDPNDDTLTYDSNSTEIIVNEYSGVFSYYPEEEDVGVHNVRFYVYDGTYIVTRDVSIIVEAAQ
jgi:hypothetical protein